MLFLSGQNSKPMKRFFEVDLIICGKIQYYGGVCLFTSSRGQMDG
jgi:hypothetical protein